LRAGNLGRRFRAGLQRDRWALFFKKVPSAILIATAAFRQWQGTRHRPWGLPQGAGRNDVYVLGLATDYCVKFTAIDAVELGFKTYLILDACRAVNLQPGDEQHAVEEMRAAGVESSLQKNFFERKSNQPRKSMIGVLYHPQGERSAVWSFNGAVRYTDGPKRFVSLSGAPGTLEAVFGRARSVPDRPL